MIKFSFFIILSILLFIILLIRNKYNKNNEKLINFECGFNSFTPSRNPFSIQFFKILIIFLIFDIEIIVILPLPLKIILDKIILINFIIIIIILILGLIFE